MGADARRVLKNTGVDAMALDDLADGAREVKESEDRRFGKQETDLLEDLLAAS